MPWQEQSTMSLRSEFVALAQQEGIAMAELCRRTESVGRPGTNG